MDSSKLNKNLNILQKNINYVFTSKKLLIEALTHKSHKSKPNNERLEFLGDSVVNLSVGKYIYYKFKNYQEGKMSKLRASLVNEESLSILAKSISLGDFIFLSLGEENNGGRHKPSILSDALEAIIGAMFLEVGLDATYKMVATLIEKEFKDIKLEDLYKDYKTLLQEFTQSSLGVIPDYKITKEDGPEHQKIFTVSVYINNKPIATSDGTSKKHAQQNSAKIALEVMKNE